MKIESNGTTGENILDKAMNDYLKGNISLESNGTTAKSILDDAMNDYLVNNSSLENPQLDNVLRGYLKQTETQKSKR